MNDKIFAILEFEKIREMLGKWATSQPGLELCRNLMPETDIETVQRLQDETSAARERIRHKHQISFHRVTDLTRVLESLEKGNALSAGELLRISDLLECAQKAKEYGCREIPEEAKDLLDARFNRLSPLAKVNQEIKRCIRSESELFDTASPGLDKVRKKIRATEDKIQNQLRAFISGKYRGYLSDLLVMCGSMGCGPIAMMVERLYKNLPEDTEVSVICGTIERLQKKLERKYRDADQIHIVGYTKQMSLYMDSADLCLMKPGGLSVTEAAVKKLPMALINAVAGCEQYNIEYFAKRGGAVSSDSPEELTDQCIRLLQSERKLKEMEKALWEYRRAEGARQIFETMDLLNTAKIYWKDTAYVERESDGLPQVPAGQIKYTRV